MPPSLFLSLTYKARTRKPWSRAEQPGSSLRLFSMAEEPQFRDPPYQYTPRGALVSTCVPLFLLGISLCLSPPCISHPYSVGEVHPSRRIVEELFGAPPPLGHHAGHGGGVEEERKRSANHSTFSRGVVCFIFFLPEVPCQQGYLIEKVKISPNYKKVPNFAKPTKSVF